MSVDVAKSSIELQVTSLDQLFNSLDPFPFRERDLDKSAEEYIVSWARELPSSAAIDIVIHLPAAGTKHWHEQEVKDAFRHYFDYRADITGRAFRELFRIGRRSLAIGAVVLLVSVGLSEFSLRAFGHQGFAAIFSEGLIILGWVANWRPLEILLYDWWPIARQRRLYRRLAAATVSFSLNEKAVAVASG
jgi:hypothetical protein